MYIILENGISTSGTVRANRLHNCTLPKKKVPFKKINHTV